MSSLRREVVIHEYVDVEPCRIRNNTRPTGPNRPRQASIQHSYRLYKNQSSNIRQSTLRHCCTDRLTDLSEFWMRTCELWWRKKKSQDMAESQNRFLLSLLLLKEKPAIESPKTKTPKPKHQNIDCTVIGIWNTQQSNHCQQFDKKIVMLVM